MNKVGSLLYHHNPPSSGPATPISRVFHSGLTPNPSSSTGHQCRQYGRYLHGTCDVKNGSARLKMMSYSRAWVHRESRHWFVRCSRTQTWQNSFGILESKAEEGALYDVRFTFARPRWHGSNSNHASRKAREISCGTGCEIVTQ